MFIIRLFLVFILLCLTTYTVPLVADETAESKPQADDKKSDPENTQTSEVERLLELETTLKNDNKKLRDFEKNLKERTAISEKLQGALKKYNNLVEQHQAKLSEAKKKGDSKRVTRLENEITKIDSDHELLKQQAQLTFDAEKTVRLQIQLLKKSILQQKQALEVIKGIKPPTPVVAEPVTISSPPLPAKTSPALPVTPMQKVITDAKSSAATTQAPVSPTVDHLQTAEQIEAQKQARKRTQEALHAEKVAIDYIEQKSVLLEQMKLDENLLQTDTRSLENYNKIALEMQKKYDDKPFTILSQRKKNTFNEKFNIIKSEIKKLSKQIEARKASIKKIKKHIKQREEDQAQLAKEAVKKRERAEAAQEQVIWLQSPLHPRNLLAWVYTRGPRVLLALIITILLLFINKFTAHKISRLMARKSSRKGEKSVNRANTLTSSFRGAARVVILFGGMLIIFQEAGVDIKTVLGGAAILGIAVAFGAQNLMRDYFNGFMILLEDQYELNDIVTINDTTGTVERVSMRTTMLRDLNGRAHFIPNGAITRVTNSTYEWARAVFEIPVAYKENVDHVMSVILELANELHQDKKLGSAILAAPVMLGVNSFDENGLTIKFMLQTRADEMWPIRREMLRRIKNKFDELGIEIPVPQRVVLHQGPDKYTTTVKS